MSRIEKSGKKTVLNGPLMDMDFETFNPILNMGGLFLTLILYLTQIFIFLVLKVILKLMKKNESLVKENEIRLNIKE
jgi:hypothetical protein